MNMPKLVIVCSNIIEENGNFLLVKETKNEAKGMFSFPQGTLEGNEDLIEAAIREAREETGFIVNLEKLVGIYQRPKSEDGNNVIVLVFKSEIISGSLETSEKHPIVRFFSKEEIIDLSRRNLIRSKYMMPAFQDFLEGNFIDISRIKILM